MSPPKPNHPALHKTIHPDDAATKHIETDLTNHQIFFFTPTPNHTPDAHATPHTHTHIHIHL